MMKIIIAIFSIAVIGQAHITDEQKVRLKEFKESCIAGSGVKVEVVEKTKEGEFPEDPLLNEFLFCLGKKIEFLSEAGEFRRDIMKIAITEGHSAEDADALISACTTTIQATPQLTSLEFAKCLYENSKDHFSIA